MKIRFVDNSILDVKDIMIENNMLQIFFNDKPIEEIKTILSSTTNLTKIEVLDDNDNPYVYYENFTVFAGIYINNEITKGMLLQEVDPVEKRLNEVEKNSIEISKKVFEIENVVNTEMEPISLTKYVCSIATQDFDDMDAISVKNIYPIWSDIIGDTVKIGYKFIYENKLYKTKQDKLLIQEQYIPGVGTESIYEVIDESHKGTVDDPIPYDGNMELFEGKYYIQDNIKYLCTRGTESTVYNKLSELVDIYVKKVDK